MEISKEDADVVIKKIFEIFKGEDGFIGDSGLKKISSLNLKLYGEFPTRKIESFGEIFEKRGKFYKEKLDFDKNGKIDFNDIRNFFFSKINLRKDSGNNNEDRIEDLKNLSKSNEKYEKSLNRLKNLIKDRVDSFFDPLEKNRQILKEKKIGNNEEMLKQEECPVTRTGSFLEFPTPNTSLKNIKEVIEKGKIEFNLFENSENCFLSKSCTPQNSEAQFIDGFKTLQTADTVKKRNKNINDEKENVNKYFLRSDKKNKKGFCSVQRENLEKIEGKEKGYFSTITLNRKVSEISIAQSFDDFDDLETILKESRTSFETDASSRRSSEDQLDLTEYKESLASLDFAKKPNRNNNSIDNFNMGESFIEENNGEIEISRVGFKIGRDGFELEKGDFEKSESVLREPVLDCLEEDGEFRYFKRVVSNIEESSDSEEEIDKGKMGNHKNNYFKFNR